MGLRNMFRSSTDEIWRQIEKDIGGEYIDRGHWKPNALVYRHGEWQIVLDTFVVMAGSAPIPFTRMRAPFVNKDEFYFCIYPEGFFSKIRKFFGMQDVEIGDELFDKQFIIKSNNEAQVTRLLQSAEIKELIQFQQNISFEIKDDEGFFGADFPDGVDELYLQISGVINDKKQLLALFKLFSAVLERLVDIDSAYDQDPQVKLI